jgi:uncharacterized membrane protein
MRARLLELLYLLTRNFWVLPGAMLACAIGLYAFSITFNGSGWVAALRHYDLIYAGGMDGARQILTVVAETMVAIASLVFASVLVVLTLATSQFGQRLIGSFMRDKTLQFGFGIFVGTYVYCLIVLHLMRGAAHVPRLSVSVGFYLAIVAGATLIYLTHHISKMVEAPSVIAEVGRELDAVIEVTYPSGEAEPEAEPKEAPAAEHPAGRGGEVRSQASGYIQTLDARGLVEFAAAREVVIELLVRPGDYIFAGTPFAEVWPAARCKGGLRAAIGEHMVIGDRRTTAQDLRFAFNQLAEIAVRAMSPALNDPFTALDCVNRIGAGLTRLATRRELPVMRHDAAGQVRVITRPVGFAEAVETAFTPVRNYTRASVIVTLQMLEVIGALAPLLANAEQRRALALQAILIRAGADSGLHADYDRKRVRRVCQRALDRLGVSEADTRGLPN